MNADEHGANEQEAPQADTWAVVEVMGHSRYAGRISQDQSLGFPMLRIDVPAVDGRPAFTTLRAPSSLFSVTPCTEAVALAAAREFRARPLNLLCLPDTTPRLPGMGEDDGWDDPDEG